MFANPTMAAAIRRHLVAGQPSRRWVTPSVTREPGLLLSLIASHDQGTHASGWWRNSDYDRCWHLSLVAIEKPSPLVDGTYADLPGLDLRAWSRAVFGEHLTKAWIEPPASKLDPHRTAPASPYTTHVRVFLDQAGHPIQPEGEVYALKPWSDGSSPPKVFRS